VRYVWSNITATSAHFEEAFSADDGKTCEVNWITEQTRVTVVRQRAVRASSAPSRATRANRRRALSTCSGQISGRRQEGKTQLDAERQHRGMFRVEDLCRLPIVA
jgi:hypothetical protein